MIGAACDPSTRPTAPGAKPEAGPVAPARPPLVRLNDFYEVYRPADPGAAQRDAGRCMKCGTAYCVPDSGYGAGCPIHNRIPEWNELVRLGRWREAYERLSVTNPFPEFTARVCPAPCQDACIHGINDRPVEIKGIERAIIDRAFDSGWVRPSPPERRTGRCVAVVGSGPAGLAAADRLNRMGHYVCVFERDDRIGGLLTYGVPNMKLDKRVVARRVALLAAAGIRFRTGAAVGRNVDPAELLRHYDAVLLACGAQRPRDLDLPGRSLAGVELAMPYLTAATRGLLGNATSPATLSARGRDVVVIGGGDTGADCVATALRQGCRSLVNITRRDRPPAERDARHPWPGPTGAYTLDYAHVEGAARFGDDPRAFGVEPLAFLPSPTDPQAVAAVRIRRVDNGRVEDLPAQLVILAVGFTGHDNGSIAEAFGIAEARGALLAEGARSSRAGVYVAGDCRRGPSLVVWAIREGIEAADAIDADLSSQADGMVDGRMGPERRRRSR